MDKHKLIVIISSIAIVSTVGFSALSIYALETLELRWNQRGNFDFLTMINGGQIEICNPSPFFANLQTMSIETYYQQTKLGSFSVKGEIINPGATSKIFGKGKIEGGGGQMLSMYLDTEISGNDIARVDANKMIVLTKFTSNFLGIIPYESVRTFSGYEFRDIMNSNSFSCSEN